MDYSAFQYKKSDAKQFETEALLANAGLLISLILYGLNILPLILLIVVVSICITRWMICVHELFHIAKGKDIHPLVRLILIPFTPLNIGYDEYQNTHMGHHRYNAESEDPEGFHIRQSHLKSLLVSMTYPEQSFFRYLKNDAYKNKTLTLKQWTEISIRLFLFIALLTLFTKEFLIFWLVLRLCYGVNIWIFFHALHVKNGIFGTYAIQLPTIIQKIYQFLYGKHSLEATLHHNIHHQWPRMAYWHLKEHQVPTKP